MASKDKLIPNALIIANNLRGTKYSTGATYKQPGKKLSKYNNLVIDAVNYISSIYAKEIKVADSNAVWNYRLADGKPQTDIFTVDQNTHHENLGMIVAFSEKEWDELQSTISRVINIIYPLKSSYYSLYSPTEITNYFSQMGIFNGGATPTKGLLDADGNLIGTFAQGVTFADRWNSLKVPADAALDVDTPFIAPIYQPTGETSFYYRYTGKRRWATPFTDYNKY
jgi:hypothetical protein